MAKHMKTFDKISREIDYGAGVRYMVIRADLMYDAPDSLLDITTEMTGRDILNSDNPGLNFKELGKRQPMREDTIYRVFAFKDGEKEVSHKEALSFAEKINMRLPTRKEVGWIRANREQLPQWKHSIDPERCYWTNHIPPVNSTFLYYFFGDNAAEKGTEDTGSKCWVRCIAKM